jgi:DNA polymerase-1
MSEQKKKRLVLLDAHAIIHRAYHALPEFASSKGEPTGALYGLTTMLIRIVNDLKPDWVIAAYDLPKPTHRHEVYKEYKQGRAKTDDALVAQLIKSRDLLTSLAVPIYDKEGFEADDVLGTIVEKLKDNPEVDIIIASGDMDTLQLIDGKKVRVYTLKRGLSDTVMYDEEGVIKRFGFGPKLLPDFKGLRGDPSDNIIGIKGIGEKTASILIQNFGSIEDIYKALEKAKDNKIFSEIGITDRIVNLLKDNKEEAEFSKILALIRRDAPIDFKLPAQRWADEVELAKADDAFVLYEFRTMGARLREALKNSGREAVVPIGELPFGGLAHPEVVSQEPVGSQEFKQASIMLWLLNSSLTNPTLEDIRTYTRKDNLHDAISYLETEIKKQGLERVYKEIERPLMNVIEKMNLHGVRVDVDYLTKLGKEYRTNLQKIEKKIWELAGTEFNVASPKQLGEIIFVKLGLKAKGQKKTAGGALSTKESELAKLVDVHPIVPLILEFREHAKLLGTYIDNVIPIVGKDSRLHANFLSAGTTTGRMSSENPNLQNIPHHSELGLRIRNAFVAEPEFSLVALDYSQIELRIAAFLSDDKELINIFKAGKDIHTAVAAAVFNVPLDKVDREMRRRAKVINFGVMYGMGVSALQKNLGSDRKDAQLFYDSYFETFSGLAKYLDSVKVETAKRGYTETVFGRRRYFEGINSRLPFIKAAAERMAINAPIQGTEADIIKLAMVEADNWISKKKLDDKVFLELQVHDELVYEIKNDVLDEVIPEIKKIMETVLPEDVAKGVPIIAEAKIGTNWGEMKPL